MHLFICLIAAHVLGDFVFQSDSDAQDKWQVSILTKHSLIHAALAYAVSGVWHGWQIPLLIFFFHFIIDGTRVEYGSDLKVFSLDQAAHVASIASVAWLLSATSIETIIFWEWLFGETFFDVAIIVTGLIVTVGTGGIVVGIGLTPFAQEYAERKRNEKDSDQGKETNEILENEREPTDGFKEGGKQIGQLERLLIFILVLIGQASAIGFLVAAKSIFRFGELKDHENRLQAEYIVIGTLMSFSFAILASYLTHFILGLE
jgi:hypothetical protein